MNVVSAEWNSPTSAAIRLERDGKEVGKTLHLNPVHERMVGSNAYITGQLSLVMREADRDIAYAMHGDDFREFCEFRDNFWKALPTDALVMLECFVADRPPAH